MKASDPLSVSVENAASSDDFDQWVSGRLQSGQAALTASQRYSGVYDYTSGFGDLYTFGGWYAVDGYCYCWRPYGVSAGWNPFQFGNWFFDPAFGNWVFVVGQPWGWLPYHYGNWIFHPGLGWVWTPTGSFPHTRTGNFGRSQTAWRPVTARWVRSGSQVGLVPTHPLDTHGKTPTNLREGIFPVSQRGSEIPGARGTAPATSRNSLPPSARNSVAPPVPRQSSSGGRAAGAAGSNGNSRGGGSSSSSSSGSSRTWLGGSSSSGASSSGSSHPSSSRSSGGRPHSQANH